jgi:hypothetical protein
MISKEKKKYFTELLTQNLLELSAQANKIVLDSAELKDRTTRLPALVKYIFVSAFSMTSTP